MYKNKICGVYLITNNLNGMSYVGQSTDCKSRWSYHKGLYAKSPIDKVIKEYGKENFTFRIEKECLPEELDFYEQEVIKKYNTLYPNGYNYQGGGKNGFEFCEESRKKMRESRKGEGNPMYNHKHTDETRRKQSESAKTRTGEKNGFYKHTHTDEVKRKISETKKGKPNPQSKYKYLTPQGEIKEMHPSHVSHWHKDWIKIEE